MTPRDAIIDRILSPLGEEWAREHMHGKPVLDWNGKPIGGLKFVGATPCGNGISLEFTIDPTAVEAKEASGFLAADWPADTPLPAAVWSNHVGPPAGFVRLPDRVEFDQALGQILADLWVSKYTARPTPGPIDYSRGVTLPADLIGEPSGTNYAAAFTANPWRDRFTVAASTIGSTNLPTAADIAANVAAMKAEFGPPEPEQAIITPSLDALRAVVPFDAPNAIQQRSPTDFRTADGIRVVVTKHAACPQLIPASALDRPPFTVAFEDSPAARFERPPLGVYPAQLWREDNPQPTAEDRAARVADLRGAIQRFTAAGVRPPTGWAAEIEEHAAALVTGFVDSAESFLDQLDAIADSPDPIVVVEGPPDAAPPT